MKFSLVDLNGLCFQFCNGGILHSIKQSKCSVGLTEQVGFRGRKEVKKA